MFDVNFAELLVIFVVALIVLGPTRLPGLVSKVGRWVGKARTMARQFREQLENEVNLEELNRMTEAQTKASRTPPPPPGFNGEPAPAEPVVAESTTAAVPDPNEDIYSHAHEAGGAPMPDVFPSDPDAPPPAPAAETEELPIPPLDEPPVR